MFVLGGGSNLLVSDAGFAGLVIKNEIMGIEIHGREMAVSAGESWDKVVARAVESGLQGIECLSGVPGSAGGAVVQNIGAYGQDLQKVVTQVEVIDLDSGETKSYLKDQCEFDYRNSVFKKSPGRYIVTKFMMTLNYGETPELNYPSLQKRFEGQKPTLVEVRRAVIEIRASKGMVIMPEFEALKSAGSFFKNPVISQKQLESILHMISCPDPWHWPVGADIKVSAACLITQAGFSKGQMIGKAQISHLQPLALVNPDQAKASDIVFAADHIKHRIKEKFGVLLEEEVMTLGEIAD